MPIETKTLLSPPFIVPIGEYASPASRIRGFQELFTYGLQAPTPMLVVGNEAFKEYVEHGSITPLLRASIEGAFDQIRTANPERGAYIGRAFFVPGIDNPNGPRTAGIYDKAEYVREVEKFYEFVITHGYHTQKEADIALVLHPFFRASDPRPTYGEILLKENEKLPWSGGVVVPHPEPGHLHQVKIVATFGADEAVKSYPSDVIHVDPERETVTHKEIALKDETTVPIEGSQYDEHYPIPPRFQLEQALRDAEALAVAQEATKVFTRRPNARIEFMMQKEGVFIREIAPWEPEDDTDLFRLKPEECITAPIVRITSEEDIAKIKGPEAIVYFPAEVYRRRTTDVFTTVAHLPDVTHLIALCWGEITTAHALKVLGESGHSIIMVGDRDFPDGLEVGVYRGKDNKPVIEPLDPYYDAIIPLSDVHRLAHGEAGQKMGRLALMKSMGIPVPDGFTISSRSVSRYLHDIGVSHDIASLDEVNLTDQDEVERITSAIQQKILSTPLPMSLDTQIHKAMKQHGFSSYAIRSSGSEDGMGQSRAGLYQSEINIPPGEVSDRLRYTIASYYSPASIIDIREAGQHPSQIIVGVGIHEYIPDAPGTLGAVAFTYRDTIVIETAEGSPESIVSNTATNYMKIEVDRHTDTVTVTPVGSPKQNISEDTILAVTRVIRQIEELFQSYQDVELLIEPNGQIHVFQARPR